MVPRLYLFIRKKIHFFDFVTVQNVETKKNCGKKGGANTYARHCISEAWLLNVMSKTTHKAHFRLEIDCASCFPPKLDH